MALHMYSKHTVSAQLCAVCRVVLYWLARGLAGDGSAVPYLE
jgi:hypothetical protein